MRIDVSEWNDTPENILKCTGYVILADNGTEVLTTIGPFDTVYDAVAFCEALGAGDSMEIKIQPLTMLKSAEINERTPAWPRLMQ